MERTSSGEDSEGPAAVLKSAALVASSVYICCFLFQPALFRATTPQKIAPEMKTARTLAGGGVQHSIDCGMKMSSLKLQHFETPERRIGTS